MRVIYGLSPKDAINLLSQGDQKVNEDTKLLDLAGTMVFVHVF